LVIYDGRMNGSGPHFTATCLALYELGRANYAFVTLALRPGTSTRRPYASMLVPVISNGDDANVAPFKFLPLHTCADGLTASPRTVPWQRKVRTLLSAGKFVVLCLTPSPVSACILGLLRHLSLGSGRGHSGRVPMRHPADLRAARPSARDTRAAGALPLGSSASDVDRHRARARPRRRPLFAQAHLPPVIASAGTH